MKLIIKQYLSSLKERKELDAVLPDLLSQMGLNVFSRPRIGTRQDGVDVAAVGSINGETEKIYLLSIKAGNLNRQSWNGGTLQSLRPSLDEIFDAYIPNRLPNEHRDKQVVICLCFGGDIHEEVRPQVKGYIERHTTDSITFEEWNGDKIASLILDYFLREDLLPPDCRSQLRKSLALIDEPTASFKYFKHLASTLLEAAQSTDMVEKHITFMRQINICLWILFSWARDSDNLESVYLSSEQTLLYAWEIKKMYRGKNTKGSCKIEEVFQAILSTYFQITSQYLEKISPLTRERHVFSVGVKSGSYLDINLKLFDVLGRLAISASWILWSIGVTNFDDTSFIEKKWSELDDCIAVIKQLITNNPILFSPIMDSQFIDIALISLVLLSDNRFHVDIQGWLLGMTDRMLCAYNLRRFYPCARESYSDLLEHPNDSDPRYFQEVTSASVLLPMLALISSLINNKKAYQNIRTIQQEYLPHSNFQFWYVDESSEAHFYTGENVRNTGGVVSHFNLEDTMESFLQKSFSECSHSPHFERLSAIEAEFWPILLVACRHYRIPIPLDLFKEFI
jgi:hypothetical protein